MRKRLIRQPPSKGCIDSYDTIFGLCWCSELGIERWLPLIGKSSRTGWRIAHQAEVNDGVAGVFADAADDEHLTTKKRKMFSSADRDHDPVPLKVKLGDAEGVVLTSWRPWDAIWVESNSTGALAARHRSGMSRGGAWVLIRLGGSQ